MIKQQQQIIDKITKNLNPSYLKVLNESHMHSGDSTESHFKLVVASEEFLGLQLIARHRKINTILAEELSKIHALAIHAYTKVEWQKIPKAPNSPQCEGG